MSNPQDQHNQTIDLLTLADAHDGSEILFAVARLLENKHGMDYGYAHPVRKTAHAVHNMTDQIQPWVVANEADPLLKEMWQDLSPRDHVQGADSGRSTFCPILEKPRHRHRRGQDGTSLTQRG